MLTSSPVKTSAITLGSENSLYALYVIVRSAASSYRTQCASHFPSLSISPRQVYLHLAFNTDMYIDFTP